MSDETRLRELLLRLDGGGYGGYKRLRGRWDLGDMQLCVDRVQGDPFAAPSRIRVLVPASLAALPDWCLQTADQRVATADFLTRAFADDLHQHGPRRRGSGKSGAIGITVPAQAILPRSSVIVRADGEVEARITVGLPAAGRRVLGREAIGLLLDDVPDTADAALRFVHLDSERLQRHVRSFEDQQALRGQLKDRALIAFIADGACLPRATGIDPRPLSSGAVLFQSPDQLRVTLLTPWSGDVTGMGVPEGVTLVVGGGYHGKSTVLRALQAGVHNHVPGDGRERVVCRPDAVKIRAEDGRRVEKVDIAAFIGALPGGKDTSAFSTDSASGSTSQAAGIVEALQAGAGVLLIDEDTSATNFLIRDRRMRALVSDEKEPITPLIARISGLFADLGVSVVLVMGGSGDYFEAADTVVMMDAFLPHDVTSAARRIAHDDPRPLPDAALPCPIAATCNRQPDPRSVDPAAGKRDRKISAVDARQLRFGRNDVDLSALEQLVEPAQVRAIGEALVWLRDDVEANGGTLAGALDRLDDALTDRGLELIARDRGDFALPRRHEIAAALNRLRTLRCRIC